VSRKSMRMEAENRAAYSRKKENHDRIKNDWTYGKGDGKRREKKKKTGSYENWIGGGGGGWGRRMVIN